MKVLDLLKMTTATAVLAYVSKRLELSTNKEEMARLKKKKADLEKRLGLKSDKLLKKKVKGTQLTLAQVIVRDMKKNKK